MEDKLDKILENQKEILKRMDVLEKKINNPHFWQNLWANLAADGIFKVLLNNNNIWTKKR